MNQFSAGLPHKSRSSNRCLEQVAELIEGWFLLEANADERPPIRPVFGDSETLEIGRLSNPVFLTSDGKILGATY